MNKTLLYSILIVSLALAGCASAAASPTAAPAAAQPAITVEGVWGRPSPMMAEAGAFYMILRNGGGEADRLTAVKTDACGTVELHETYDKGDGTMGMRPVEAGYIEIPANGAAELKPGGLHVMCLMKKADFAVGATLSLTLVFEKAGEIAVEADIRDQ
jgi:hypothetical protein